MTPEQAEIAAARAERDLLRAERDLLRDAIITAGFSVMQTSGAWSIHDVSERAKQLEEDDFKRATRNVELEIENDRLRAACAAAEAYILTLRQIVYSSVPGVPEAAWERVNEDGSRWTAVLADTNNITTKEGGDDDAGTSRDRTSESVAQGHEG